MMTKSIAWSSAPAFEMELKSIQLVDGSEIRFQGDSYSDEGDYLEGSLGLQGRPLVLYSVLEVPIEIVKRLPPGDLVVYDETSPNPLGGLIPAPSLPGPPCENMKLYQIDLVQGSRMHVQSHAFRIEGEYFHFSINCRTELGRATYDLVSVPRHLVSHDPEDNPSIEILDVAS